MSIISHQRGRAGRRNAILRRSDDVNGRIFKVQKSGADDRIASMIEEASYTCDACGEDIEIPIDLSAGTDQEYVEDCPVCCCPIVIHVQIAEDGDVTVSARAE